MFLLLAGVFLGCMTMLNILGITRFIHIGPLQLAVGVLPYPLTFLCTDFISELYGRRRANAVVWTGLLLNVIVIAFLALGGALPAIEYKADFQRLQVVRTETIVVNGEPWTDEQGTILTNPATGLPFERIVSGEDDMPVRQIEQRAVRHPATGEVLIDPKTAAPLWELVDAETGTALVQEEELYDRIYVSTTSAVFASMLAYLAAQFCDVFLFHFWKRLTRGRHLWLRNNGSTAISQLVDATAVMSVTFGSAVLSGAMSWVDLASLIRDNYAFKIAIALIDTIPFYIGVRFLSRYLQIDPQAEFRDDR